MGDAAYRHHLPGWSSVQSIVLFPDPHGYSDQLIADYNRAYGTAPISIQHIAIDDIHFRDVHFGGCCGDDRIVNVVHHL